MTCFVLTILLLLVAIPSIVAASLFGSERGVARVLGLVGLGLAVVTFVISISAPVGTKNVAVLTTFGKPVGSLGNGFHFKAPWQVKHELPDAIQTDTYASDSGQGVQHGADGSCVHVRMARQSTGCVNVSIRWQIRKSGVDYLFRNFTDNQAITKNVVLRDLQSSLNEQFNRYDPLGIDGTGNNTNLPLAGGESSYSTKVLTQMRDEIGQWIDVTSVIIPILNFDSSTQDRINALLQQVAQTRVAQQAEQTALAQARANRALATSVSNDPNVLVSKCLDIVKEVLDSGKTLPAGFSCFGGSTTGIAVSPGQN